MSMLYQSAGYIIDVDQHTIKKEGVITPIRVRTFILLLQFLAAPKIVLSKQELLDAVWDDVEVDEPVLFQSIRELRILFKQSDLIKNYPKKGYAWTAEVEHIEPNKNKEAWFLKLKKTYNKFLLSIVFITVLLSASYFVISSHNQSLTVSEVSSFKGSIFVLPFKSTIKSTDHQWVRLGAMDQLIALLNNDSNNMARSTEIVLELMGQANLHNGYSQDQINNLFLVTDAGIIVESNLSGNIEEYRLSYKFIFKNQIKQGILFSTNIDNLLVKLSDKINFYTGGKKVTKLLPSYESDFRSELIARAFNEYEKYHYKQANILFQSVISLEPDNIIARRKYAETLIFLGQYEQAQQSLEETIGLTEHKSEQARLYYWLAILSYYQKKYSVALSTLILADDIAEKYNDWLYQAYISDLQGTIYALENKYTFAQYAFDDALVHYGDVFCPIGRTRTQLKLANLHFKNKNFSASKSAFTQADKLFTTYKLSNLQLEYDKTNKLLVDNIVD